MLGKIEYPNAAQALDERADSFSPELSALPDVSSQCATLGGYRAQTAQVSKLLNTYKELLKWDAAAIEKAGDNLIEADNASAEQIFTKR